MIAENALIGGVAILIFVALMSKRIRIQITAPPPTPRKPQTPKETP